ncbi:MAG: alpha-hydroxy-acid oxidizing protein, partial [Chloroflexi bacterium]|nr:alpha-hydroxy-acid oxidizing protein [Chloroflexota bacterium]
MPDAADLGFMTMGELERIAEPKVPAHVWDYANGGSASEITLRRNRAALDRLAIEQRILVDVRQIDLSTEFLREQVPSPVMIAPMGSLGRFHPEGDLEMARGAGRKGGFSTVTGVCSWPMEQIAQEASGPLIFQLYFFGDRDWAAKRLERVQTCPQYKAVVLTVDTAVYSRRDRDLARRYSAPADRSGALEPLPPDRSYPARLTWDDFDWLREQVRLPLGIKGVLHPDDARRAIDHGSDLIWVSNHGGRQLDG